LSSPFAVSNFIVSLAKTFWCLLSFKTKLR